MTDFDYSAGLAAVHAAVFGDDPSTGKPYAGRPHATIPTAPVPAPVKSEAERLAELDGMILPGTESLVARAKADGRHAVQIAAEALSLYQRHLIANDQVSPSESAANLSSEEFAVARRSEWHRFPELRSEFPSADIYAAYRAGIASGRVTILGGAVPRSPVERPVNMPAAEARWRAEYHDDAALQREFRSEGAYVGFKKAEAYGRVHIIGGKR